MGEKGIDSAALRLETSRVLQSRVFGRAQRSQRFLRYLVEAALADPPVSVKEYTAAIDVFDRNAAYDPSVDATVRVEASRLRSRLREYYAEEGRHDPWLIELPKGAYSIVFTPRQVAPGTLPEEKPSLIGVPRPTRYTRRAQIGGAVAAGLLLFFLTRHNWGSQRSMRRNEPLQVRAITPITTDPGMAQDPAISPDGTELAYSWHAEDGLDGTYLKSLSEQQSLTLTHSKDQDRYPVWSPDGKEIVFARFRSQDSFDVIRIPARGGRETVIRKAKWGLIISASGRIFAWTADHKWLCFPDQEPDGHFQLRLLSPDTGDIKPLHPQSSNWDESSPAFSRDGEWVAFVRFYGVVSTQLVIQKLSSAQQTTGQPTVVSDTPGSPSSPIWLDDGRLVYLDRGNLMQTSWRNPSAHQFYAANSDLRSLAYDSVHSRLIASQTLSDGDIWSLPLKGTSAAGAPGHLVRSTANEQTPAFSPNGKWLAFVSNRSGAAELWLADSDGHNPRQLTRLSAGVVGFPQWSADSRFIVFHARVPQTPEVYLLNLEDRSLRKLTDGEPGFFTPSFSKDGKSVYGAQRVSGGSQLYRLNIEEGSRELLWYGENPVEVPGRNTLLYTKAGHPGIFERSLAGEPRRNPETRLVLDIGFPIQRPSLTAEGFFYTGLSRSSDRSVIRFYSFATQHSHDIALADLDSIVSIKPDRTSLAYDGSAAAESQLVGIKLDATFH